MVRMRYSFFALGLLAFAFPALAQQQPGVAYPRLDTITPMGAKFGTTIDEFVITGTDLDEADALIFSHPNIKAEIFVPPPPKVDPKADPKKKDPPPMPPKGPLPPNKFKITVGADVPPGRYDVRAKNKLGLSNPRSFVVGDLPEVQEKEPNNDVPQAQKIDINNIVNGVILTPTDVDLYTVTAKKGQRLVMAVAAGSIDSRARPQVELFDKDSKRIAFANATRGSDTVADALIPEDGEYFVRVTEFTHTVGGPQNFYRLTVTTNPWIDAVYPPVVEPGKAAQVTLYGRNLPGGTPAEPPGRVGAPALEKLVVTINAPANDGKQTFSTSVEPKQFSVDGFEYRLKGPSGMSNPIVLGFAREKIVTETEPNDTTDKPQVVTYPCEIMGRIDKRNDMDWYSFDAKKGEVVMIDLLADRIGSGTDLYFTLVNPKSKAEITEQDDNPEILSPTQFFNRTSDPAAFKFVVPEDGSYLVRVGSREGNFLYGPTVAYRLKIGKEQPDFKLAAMPPSIILPDVTVLRAGGANYLSVFVHRQDGFTGTITLTAEGLPAGVTCAPQTIGPNQKLAQLVLEAAPSAVSFEGPIVVKGTATIGGKSEVRIAKPYTIMWAGQAQQNTPVFTRADQSLYLVIRDKAHFTVTPNLAGAFIKKEEKITLPLTAKQGEKITVPFTVNRISNESKVAINVQGMATSPGNAQQLPITIGNNNAAIPVTPDKTDGAFVIDIKPNALPGVYTLALKATAVIQYDRGDKKTRPATIEYALPPVTIEVLPTALAKVTITPLTAPIAAGKPGEYLVKIERLNEFAGEYKIKTVLPPTAKGITIDEFTVPAGQTDVKVPVKVAADAPGNKFDNLVNVIVTGTYGGKHPIAVEAKMSLQTLPSSLGKITSVAPMAPFAPGAKPGELVVKVERLHGYTGDFALKLALPPTAKGITLPPTISIAANQNEVKIPVTIAADAPPAKLTDFVVTATVNLENKYPIVHEGKASFEVLPASFGKVTIAPPKAIPAGTDGELVVKVERLHGYVGDYKIKVTLPATVKGVTIAEATIAANQTEVKIPVKVAADAPAGPVANIPVAVTATYEGKHAVVTQAMASVTIEKAAPPKK